MYYRAIARVTVGEVTFNNVNKVTITESIAEMGDSATVVLPRNYGKINGRSVLDYIKKGDKVLIELGIDGVLQEEYTGYLGEINTAIPLVLEVDDNFYPLKRTNYTMSWEKITLSELLAFIAPSYTVNCPDVNLGGYQIASASAYRVLAELKQQYGFYSFIRGNVLNCQFAYDVRGTGDKKLYRVGNNIKKSGLKYHRAEDVKVRIKAIANPRKGKKLVYETGSTDDDASQRTLNYGDITLDELKVFAEKTYASLSFDGYSGTITGFAVPVTHAGDILTIENPNEPDHDGDYLVEKTVITYDTEAATFQRENTISYKV